MKIDLGVMNSDSAVIESLCRMGHSLSLSGFATSSNGDKPVKTLESLQTCKYQRQKHSIGKEANRTSKTFLCDSCS